MVHVPQAPLRLRTVPVAATAKRPARIKVLVNDNGVRSEQTIMPPRAYPGVNLHTRAARLAATRILSEPAHVTEVESKDGGFVFEGVARGY